MLRPSRRAPPARAGKSAQPAGFERAALALRIVAAVIGHGRAVALPDRRRIRHLRRLDHVAPPDFVARQARASPRSRRAAAPSRTCPAGGRRRASARTARNWSGTADVEPVGRQHIGPDHVGAGVVGERHAIGRARAVVVAQPAAQCRAGGRRRRTPPPCPSPGRARRTVATKFSRRSSIHLSGRAEQQRRGRQRKLLGMERGFRPEAAAESGATTRMRARQGRAPRPASTSRGAASACWPRSSARRRRDRAAPRCRASRSNGRRPCAAGSVP